MAKPPPSPPSTDLKDKSGAAPSSTHEEAAKGEEHARREGKGRPPQSTR